MRLVESSNDPAIERAGEPSIAVRFVLMPDFSLASYTGAVDTLMTACLTHPSLFVHSTIGVGSKTIRSDIGLDIATDRQLSPSLRSEDMLASLSILVVCGGYRCSLLENAELSAYLKWADKRQLMICSLWNGSFHLAHAGLMNNHKCAIHPENHAYFKEAFPQVELSHNSFVISEHRASCSGAVSSIEMMLGIIGQLRGEDISRATREIICCDKFPEVQDSTPLRMADDDGPMPTSLRNVIQLMRNNIDEPLSPQEISRLLNISPRKVQRLFQTYFETTPSRYYLGLRISYARQLLMQSEYEIIDVALASGFISKSHFSSCFKNHYGVSPKIARETKSSRK